MNDRCRRLLRLAVAACPTAAVLLIAGELASPADGQTPDAGSAPAPEYGFQGLTSPARPAPVPGYTGVPQVCDKSNTDCKPLKADTLIQIGSYVDTSSGGVALDTRRSDGSHTTTTVYGGAFQLLQGSGPNAVLTAKLVGDLAVPCHRRSVRAAVAAARVKRAKPRVRRLWADGTGEFRAAGRYGSATVRGTKWLIEDRCGGTYVRVTRGQVEVRDIARHHTVMVRAPDAYLARPQR